jgi:hypothetical protein
MATTDRALQSFKSVGNLIDPAMSIALVGHHVKKEEQGPSGQICGALNEIDQNRQEPAIEHGVWMVTSLAW